MQANNNVVAGGWLLLDMCLNLSALSIVKVLDNEFASIQLVFIRACIGLLLVVPFIVSALVSAKNNLRLFDRYKMQLLRGALAAAALTLSFYAVANLPIAFFVTLNFTRPLLLMLFAFVLLKERIVKARWLAGLIGLLGACIAANPQNIPWSAPMGALVVAIVIGTLGVIVLRKLKGSPWQTVMLYYAAAIVVITFMPALHQWHQPEPEQWLLLIGLGIFSQFAQFCFMRAHWLGDAGFLGPLSYLSLVLSVAVGFILFNEVPSFATMAGAAFIVLSTFILSRYSQNPNQR